MPAYYILNLILEVFVLLLCPLCHVLYVLLFVQRDFHRTTIGIHALKNLPILHACFEKGRIEREVYALFDTLVLLEWVQTLIL